MRRRFVTSTILAMTMISACSGGGDGVSVNLNLNNVAPVFSSSANISISENSVGVVYTANASDSDGDTVTIALSGGPDAGSVTLDANTGALSFTAELDFENPSDANGDNVYEVTLEARDGRGGIATLDLQITVTDEVDSIVVRRVGTGFNQPLGLIALPDASGRVLVLEKGGRVRLLNPNSGAIDSVDFLNVSASISTAGKGGC